MSEYKVPDGWKAKSPTHGMNLGQRISHVGGRVNDKGYVEFGSVMAVQALVYHVVRDLNSDLAAAKEIADSEGTRAVEYLRRARKAEKILSSPPAPKQTEPVRLTPEQIMQIAIQTKIDKEKDMGSGPRFDFTFVKGLMFGVTIHTFPYALTISVGLGCMMVSYGFGRAYDDPN